jgi:hypothetical protein
MKDDPKAVWQRYTESWSAASESAKREIFEQCLAPSCAYSDPLMQARGWDELSAYIVTFQRQLPGARFVTEYFLAHHGRSIARWKMLNGAGAEIGSGISYGEYDAQNRLVAMTGFFETPEVTAA